MIVSDSTWAFKPTRRLTILRNSLLLVTALRQLGQEKMQREQVHCNYLNSSQLELSISNLKLFSAPLLQFLYKIYFSEYFCSGRSASHRFFFLR